MSVASSSIRFIKFSTSSSSACTCSSHSPSSSSTFRFSATKPTFVTIIRSSQTEGLSEDPLLLLLLLLQSPHHPPRRQRLRSRWQWWWIRVITMEFQRQKAKELQEYFKQKKLDEADQGPFFGFIAKNEISNGRWAMFGFAVGMLTEYATGSDFFDQVKILLSNFGIGLSCPVSSQGSREQHPMAGQGQGSSPMASAGQCLGGIEGSCP
ncbi:hypothetical protein HYC85_008134 [Camellia sinensis]|uniref:Uncharacterized protein n=1 Tax=Camellia sinensis TaxID=4442 RepID=A0A7J7HTD3_CAMSI|nr:hypothetical protein HYC85_008134 [Camellia sinensis]